MLITALMIAAASPAATADDAEMAAALLTAFDSNDDAHLDWNEVRAMGQVTSDESAARGGGAANEAAIDNGVAFVFRFDADRDARMSKDELTLMIAGLPDYKAEYESRSAAQ